MKTKNKNQSCSPNLHVIGLTAVFAIAAGYLGYGLFQKVLAQSIGSPVIEITAPVGGEEWTVGEMRTISWELDAGVQLPTYVFGQLVYQPKDEAGDPDYTTTAFAGIWRPVKYPVSQLTGSFDWKVGYTYSQDTSGWEPISPPTGYTWDNIKVALRMYEERDYLGVGREAMAHSGWFDVKLSRANSIFPNIIRSNYPQTQNGFIVGRGLDNMPPDSMDRLYFGIRREVLNVGDAVLYQYKTIGSLSRNSLNDWDEIWEFAIPANTDLDKFVSDTAYEYFFVANAFVPEYNPPSTTKIIYSENPTIADHVLICASSVDSLVGFYASAAMSLTSNPSAVLQSLDEFSAEYDTPQGSTVNFMIQFLDGQGSSFNEQETGLRAASVDESYGYFYYITDSSGIFPPSQFTGDWLTEVRAIKIGIEMYTSYYNVVVPWVQSVALEYTSSAPTNQSVTLSITPATNSVVKGGASAVYTVTATRISTFIGTVALSNNIATIFGGGVTTSFNPASISFSESDVILPGGPVLTKTSLLTVTASDTATATSAKTFTVTGTITGQPSATATASLAILDASTAITLDLTIPVEETAPANFATLTRPRFTLRLYNGLTKAYEKTSIAGTAINATKTEYTAAVTATRAELPNGTYSAYIRSDRHLWSRFPSLLVIDTASDLYGLTFPALKVGNVDENNKINMIDFNAISPDYGKDIANLLGDLNNDGTVNIADLNWIITNFALWGSQLPDETR